MAEIQLAKDFSPFPGGRHVVDGPFSGEQFRADLLAPALRRHEVTTVKLDGALGYPSSFLEEAFGGLIREEALTLKDVKRLLRVEFDDGSYKVYVDLIWKYIDDAAARAPARSA